MSSLGEKIKAVFSSGSHSAQAEKGVVDHRTPGAFPVEESDTTHEHQPVAGASSEHNKDHHDHNKLHKKDDPRGNTGLVGEEGTSGVDHGYKQGHPATGLEEQRYVQPDTTKNAPTPLTSTQPSAHNTSSLATDQANRPGISAVPGTGAVAAGAGGVAARELSEDRSGPEPLVQNTSTQDTLGRSSNPPTNISRDDYTGSTSGRDVLGGDATGRDTTGLNTANTAGRNTTGLGTAGRDSTSRDTTGIGSGNATGSHSHPAAATAGGVGAGALASHELNRGADSGTGAATNQTEPYWGDLPQGAGVYNTVTGHGSGEDTSVQHRAVPKPAGGDFSSHTTAPGNTTGLGYGSGVYNTVVGHGSNDENNQAHHTQDGQRAFPLNEQSGNAANIETSPRDNQHGDRHLGEAGAVMGAGAAAYGAAEHHKHHKDKSSQIPTSSGKTLQGEGLAHRPSEATRDVPPSQGTGILHRHKDPVEETKPRHTDVSTSNDRHPQETYDNTGRHHNNEILGFMHQRKDEENANAARSQTSNAGAHHGKDSLVSGSSAGPVHDRSLNEDKSHRDRNMAGLAGAGVGAAAATGYGISHEEKRHDQTESPAQYQGQQGPVAHNVRNPASGNITGQPAAYASNNSQLDASGGTAPTATHGSNIGASQTQGLAGAGAAAGAGYGISKMGQHENAGVPPASAGQDSYGHLSSGTSSGIAPELRDQNQRTPASGLGGQTGTSHGISGGHSQGDQYNVLTSGTPSGVQVENTPTKSLRTVGGATTGQPGSQVTQECTKCGTTNNLSHYFQQ